MNSIVYGDYEITSNKFNISELLLIESDIDKRVADHLEEYDTLYSDVRTVELVPVWVKHLWIKAIEESDGYIEMVMA